MNDRFADVLVTKYAKGWRWFPNPESRKGGSQRWAVPSVDRWHHSATFDGIAVGYKALETQWG